MNRRTPLKTALGLILGVQIVCFGFPTIAQGFWAATGYCCYKDLSPCSTQNCGDFTCPPGSWPEYEVPGNGECGESIGKCWNEELTDWKIGHLCNNSPE